MPYRLQNLAKFRRSVFHRPSAAVSHPRRWIRSIQAGLFLCSGLLAFFVRFEFRIPPENRLHLIYALIVWLPLKSIAASLYRLDRGWWRFVSVSDVARIVWCNFTASIVSAGLLMWLGPAGFPRSIFCLDFAFCLIACCGVRIVARLAIESSDLRRRRGGKKIFIYGAGRSGLLLLQELRGAPLGRYEVYGFIDDARNKLGVELHGVRVLGRGKELPRLAREAEVEEVLIAIPSATGEQMTEILSQCRLSGLHARTVPSLTEVIQNRGLTAQLREVAVEDLLGRRPVVLDERKIRACVEGKTMLVTGAGGSIGSELCRQLARFGAETIVAVDTAETALVQVDREMCASFPGVQFRPELGNVQSKARVEELLERYRPEIIFHAAAYKHVPMAEAHLFEVVENNILGTFNVAKAAEKYGAKRFVMVSTDKAVRPTNLMGATKRVAELTSRSFQYKTTKYVSVRFGNVLGSNGSVVPFFMKQIAEGGPVTVTHPNMRRYLMTIPEAVQLLLQAASLGRGGEIFVLEMGEQVKIVDLAHRLIELSGLRPNIDIPVVFTEPRPGEKLYEELSLESEDLQPTHHEKIRVVEGPTLSREDVARHMELLAVLCRNRMGTELIWAIKDIVPEYLPSPEILRRYESQEAAKLITDKTEVLLSLYQLESATRKQ